MADSDLQSRKSYKRRKKIIINIKIIYLEDNRRLKKGELIKIHDNIY